MSAIMQSSTILKYNAEYIPANTPFEVEDNEIEELINDDCVVIRQSRTSAKKAGVQKLKKSE